MIFDPEDAGPPKRRITYALHGDISNNWATVIILVGPKIVQLLSASLRQISHLGMR
jgi:hypothetical protein